MTYRYDQILTKKNTTKFALIGVALVFAMTLMMGVISSVNAVSGATTFGFTQTEIDTEWEADRYFPTAGATSVTAFGRNDVARLGIDNTMTQPGTFQRTEGLKTVGTQDFGSAVEVDLYLDPAWEDTAVRAGLWVVGDNGAGARDNWFGIVEFVNNESCSELDCSNQGNIVDHEGFRVWDSEIGWTPLADEFEYGEWATLAIELDTVNELYHFYIDGTEVATGAAGQNFISEVFMNSYNYGLDSFPTLSSDSYSAHWSETKDRTPPAVPTGLQRIAPDEGDKIYACGDISKIQKMHPDWDNNTEDDFSHYEYTSFNASGAIGINERVFNDSIFEYNGSWLPGEGTYGFAVRAVDDSGNKSDWALSGKTLEGSCQITYDDTAPTTPTGLGFLNPVLPCGAITDIHYTTVNWDDSFDANGVRGYQYSIDHPGSDTLPAGTWSTFKTSSQHSGGLFEGAHYIKVRAEDNAGNLSGWSDVCSITADWTPPEAPRLVSPVNGATENGGPTQVWSHSDSSDVDHYLYESYLDSDLTPPAAYGTSVTGTSRTIGGSQDVVIWWHVAAVDAAGNISDWSDAWMLTVDNTPPDVPTLVFPQNNSFVNASSPIANDWEDVDDAVSYRYTSYNVDSEGSCVLNPIRWTGIYTSSQTNSRAITDGLSFCWMVAATDTAGNTSAPSEIWKVTIDNTAPLVAITAPADGALVSGEVAVRGSVEDDNPHHYYSVVRDSTNAVVAGPGTVGRTDSFTDEELFVWDTTLVADGEYTIWLAARDAAGNRDDSVSLATTTVTVDNTAPELTLVTPEDGDVVRSVMDLFATCDEECDYVNFWWRADGEAFNSADKQYHYVRENGTDFGWSLNTLNAEKADGTFYEMEDGVYHFYAAAKDVAGNWARSEFVMVMVDNTAPDVTINSVELLGNNGVYYYSTEWKVNDNTPTLVGTTSDNIAVDSVIVNVGGHDYTAVVTGNDWRVDVTNVLDDGTHIITTTATDTAGNTEITTQDIVIDTVAPTADYSYYKNGKVIADISAITYVNDVSELTFDGTATDADPSAGLLYDSFVIFEAQDDGSFRFSANGKKAYCSWRSEPNLVHFDGLSSFTITTPAEFKDCAATLPDGEYYMAHHVYDEAVRKDIPSIHQFRDVLGLHFVVDSVAPIVEITLPVDNTELRGYENITGSVTDDVRLSHYNLSLYPASTDLSDGLTHTSERVNGVFWCVTPISGTVGLSADHSGNLCEDWDTTKYPDGEYQIRLAARDAAGNRETSDPYSGATSSVHIVSVTIDNFPDDKDACKKGGWENYGVLNFRNQGDCVSYLMSDRQHEDNPDGEPWLIFQGDEAIEMTFGSSKNAKKN